MDQRTGLFRLDRFLEVIGRSCHQTRQERKEIQIELRMPIARMQVGWDQRRHFQQNLRGALYL